MNDINPVGPVPPPIPPGANPRPALGDDPAERVPVTGPISAIEAILRQPRRLIYALRQPKAGSLVAGMLSIALLCGLIYGVVVGSFSGHDQWWAAPVKISLGLLVSTLICLPSLYIFACLSGSQARLAELAGLAVGLLMLLTLLLIGFAPVAWLFAQSTESLVWMGILHLGFWLVATLFGLRFLVAGFATSNARSNAGLQIWIVIFMLVMLQMTTALRPLLGRSETFLPETKRFFIAHWGDCIDDATRSKTSHSRD